MSKTLVNQAVKVNQQATLLKSRLPSQIWIFPELTDCVEMIESVTQMQLELAQALQAGLYQVSLNEGKQCSCCNSH